MPCGAVVWCCYAVTAPVSRCVCHSPNAGDRLLSAGAAGPVVAPAGEVALSAGPPLVPVPVPVLVLALALVLVLRTVLTQMTVRVCVGVVVA